MTKRKFIKNRKSGQFIEAVDETNTDSTTYYDSTNLNNPSVDLITSSSRQQKSWWERWWKSILQNSSSSSSSDDILSENELFGDSSNNLSNSNATNAFPPSSTARTTEMPIHSTDDYSYSAPVDHQIPRRSSRSSSFSTNAVPFRESSSYYTRLLNYLDPMMTYFRLKYLEGDNDLYYTLRTQPFSSGIYLRGMLIAGFSNTLFHLYDFFLLSPPTAFPNLYYLTIYRIAFSLLILHILLNILSIPTRIMLHYQCWKNSRVIDSESASIALQELLSSNLWVFNRILAWTLDLISFITLVCGQIYLWNDVDDHNNNGTDALSCPYLTTLIYNLCATDILSFLIRSVVGAMYLLSFREFRDGSGIRNRGMSNFDLDRMDTFPFEPNPADEKIPDCSICLQPYELNDQLLRLPCHERHCFHVDCIREWLKRQNACPLCQKIC